MSVIPYILYDNIIYMTSFLLGEVNLYCVDIINSSNISKRGKDKDGGREDDQESCENNEYRSFNGIFYYPNKQFIQINDVL